MYKKSEPEMERLRIAKIMRNMTRLKYSLLADKELNDRLPDVINEFDKGLQQGELKTIGSEIAREILDS